MTAVNNIRYCKTNTYCFSQSNSFISFVCRAIGADSYSLSSLVCRLLELKRTNVPTLIEINGFENDYVKSGKQIDLLLKFLDAFSRRNPYVKFAVKIGNVKYIV